MPNESNICGTQYEIEKKLGSGNFGTAYLVKDLKAQNGADEWKVLKKIPIGELEADETVDAMSESRLLSKLDHPGIVKFYENFIDGEHFCIVTEYCDGGDLQDQINSKKKQGKHFSEIQILDWIIQILCALQYMHSRRVLHRDLKARNIFLRKNMIKIGDFGISRILQSATDNASTFTGTPYFMSPECLKHAGYNSKSDVWSVGCLLYELCTHEHAFEAVSLMGVMYKICEADLPVLPEKYSQKLNEVFRLMLIKEPSARLSASEMLQQPYLANHMQQLQETIATKHKAKQSDSSTIEREANEIAAIMRESTHLGDLNSMERPKPIESEAHVITNPASNVPAPTQPQKGESPALKGLTPRERMRLRRQKEADEKAKQLREAAKSNYMETRKQLLSAKGSMESTQVDKALPWVKSQERTIVHRQSSNEAHRVINDRNRPMMGGGDDGQNGSFHYEEYFAVPPDNSRDLDRTVVGYSEAEMRMQPPKSAGPVVASSTVHEDRPITPMRDSYAVYRPDSPFLDFSEGVPGDPAAADKYYTEDFDSDRVSQTVMYKPSNRGASKTNRKFKGYRGRPRQYAVSPANSPRIRQKEFGSDDTNPAVTIGANCTDAGLDELAAYMQQALNRSGVSPDQSLTISDDSAHDPFGSEVKKNKVTNLTARCIDKLGHSTFEKVYAHIKRARSHPNCDEAKLTKELAAYVNNPSDCFLVDQLVFLEMN